MNRRVWKYAILACFLSLASFWLAGAHLSVSLAQTAPASGIIHMTGPLQFDLKLSPPVGTPGDTLLLEASLVNLDQVTYTPEIRLQLPKSLRLQPDGLPTGATVNLSANRLDWFPVIPANGATQQFSLPLRVETADITHPTQTITAVLRVNGQDQEGATTIWVGLPPQVTGFNFPAQASVGLPIQLHADLSGPGPFTQSWQLGDGRQVDVTDPVVVYPAPGVYEISLTARNPLAATTATRQITIVPHPTAQFRPDDATLSVGQTITFINESGGQPPLVHRWEFGDGAIASDLNPTHTYSAPGVYTVKLTSENAFGHSEAFWTVTVGQPPQAAVQLDPVAVSGQPMQGQVMSEGEITAVTYRWDMGDGQSVEGPKIAYVYRRGGDYYVTVTASNDYGESQMGQWLHVDQGPSMTYLPVVVKPGDSLLGDPASLVDPLGIVLEPVDLDAPFVMTPLDLPAGTSQAESLLIYINEARRQFDLPPLQYVYELSVAAQEHVEDMAAYRYTGHVGSDGSFPAERLLWANYGRAYAGEATAWGFEHAYQAVEFWINSPGHRAILLNQYASDVGVAFKADYNSPNVWYWTAEFGNASGGAVAPALRVQSPEAAQSVLNTDVVDYGWNWPLALQAGQRFTVYLHAGSQSVPVGTVSAPALGTYYRLRTAVADFLAATGLFEWQVRLEDANRNVIVESERRSLDVVLDPDLPTATPPITPTVLFTPTVTPTPTATPTATPDSPAPPVLPTDVPPPVIVTATPAP